MKSKQPQIRSLVPKEETELVPSGERKFALLVTSVGFLESATSGWGNSGIGAGKLSH